MYHSTPAGEEEPVDEGAGGGRTLETTTAGALPTLHKLRQTCMDTRASGVVTPFSREGQNPHELRELPNL